MVVEKTPDEKRKDILSKGEAEIRVLRAGMYQILTFKIVRHVTPLGSVPYMTVEKFVDLPQLIKVSEEYNLPIQAPNGKIYPRGKREIDYVNI